MALSGNYEGAKGKKSMQINKKLDYGLYKTRENSKDNSKRIK